MAHSRACRLADSADWLCSTLTYDDVKRMEFSTTLACKPKLLLMNEPTAGMAVTRHR
jgi:branched-chain amino acid transport system ATP-binding protein